jgi:S1-C subfamily serine protease
MLNRRSPASLAALLALAATALSGCGSSPSVPEDGLAIAAPAEQRLIALTDLDQRVATVGHRLSTANAELCPAVRNSAGWLVHAASQYSPELRTLAEARFGLDGDLPGLLAVPEGSAADLAGLRRDDLLLSVNGEAMARGVDRRAAAFEGVEANIRQLDHALARGPVEVVFDRITSTRTQRAPLDRWVGDELDDLAEETARVFGVRHGVRRP